MFCFVPLLSHERDKLSSKTKKCIFLEHSFAYKNIGVMILLPIDFAFPSMFIFWKYFLLSLFSHPGSLFPRHFHIFQVFHLSCPTYIPSLPISISPPHISLTKSFSLFVDVTATGTLLLVTALTFSGDQLPPRRNPYDTASSCPILCIC